MSTATSRGATDSPVGDQTPTSAVETASPSATADATDAETSNGEFPDGCEWGEAEIEVTRGVSPHGEVDLVDGAFGYDICYGYPYIELYSDAGPAVLVLVDWQEGKELHSRARGR